MKTESEGKAGESATLRAVKDLAFGSVSESGSVLVFSLSSDQIAGMVSKVFEHPFDLTKVRLQAQVLDAQARFRGPIDCLYKTWKYEGVRGLFRVSVDVPCNAVLLRHRFVHYRVSPLP